MRLPIISFANALADETRLRIIHLVFDEAMCVCELADVLKLPQSTLSSHLKVIQKAAVLDSHKKGKWMFYRVAPTLRPVLKVLFKHFLSTQGPDSILAKDARKASNRLAKREANCCPE